MYGYGLCQLWQVHRLLPTKDGALEGRGSKPMVEYATIERRSSHEDEIEVG